MRDRLTRASTVSAYPFESFFIPYTTTMSLNWPYEHSQCLLPTPRTPQGDVTPTPRQGSTDATSAIGGAVHRGDDSEEYIINPVFESHLRNLDNWSLGTVFRNSFPDLVDDVKIRDVRAPVSVPAS